MPVIQLPVLEMVVNYDNHANYYGVDCACTMPVFAPSTVLWEHGVAQMRQFPTRPPPRYELSSPDLIERADTFPS